MRQLSCAIIFLLGALVFGLTGPKAGAQLISVDFDTPGDLTGKFSLNHNGFGNRYTQVATGGLGNSGAVNLLNTLDSEHTTAVYSPSSYDFAQPGHVVTISEFVRRQNASITQTPFIMLGILSDVSERMDAPAVNTNSYASIRLLPSTTVTATDVFLQTETKLNGGARQRVTPGVTGSLTAGNWYRVSATFKMTSLSDLEIGMALEDWGASGAAYLSTVMSLNPLLVSLTGADQVNGDPSVWVGFRAFDEGGADLLDNFSAAPEPATLALFGLALMLAARRREIH